MAKVTGPLFGLRARAQLGKTLVYASWKGVQYTRTYVIPANPQSTTQVQNRSLFTNLNRLWLFAPTLMRTPWEEAARGRPLSDRNLFFGANLRHMNGVSTMFSFTGSPGNGGPPPTAVNGVGGVGQIAITVTPPTTPVGWTLDGATGLAVLNGDPKTIIATLPYAAEDVAAPFVPTPTMPAGDYYCQAWLRWTDDRGFTRYSPVLRDSDLITVT